MDERKLKVNTMYKMKSFNDSHLHFVGIGANLLEYIDLSQASSINEVKRMLNQETDRDFIVARGWHENNFKDNQELTKTVLDDVSTTKPIIAIRTCGHVLICNSKMMEIASINKDTFIEGGTIDITTGEFTENALEPIYKHLPKPSKDRIKEYMIAANEFLLSQGVTACGSDDFSTLSVPYELIINCYKELYEENKIQVKVLEQVNLTTRELLQDFIDKGYVNKDYGQFKMGPLKLLADGSLGGRTAYLNEPYSDDPTTNGVTAFTQDELDDLIYLADSHQMDVAIHGIGDQSIDMIIKAIEKSYKKTNRKHRHSIIHSQLANLSQIKKMKELNISAQTQPIFLNSDIPIIQDRLGERAKETYLFNTMHQTGLVTTISTDCPVEPLNPFYNLYCAITRKSIKFGELDAFLPNEKFALKDAITCYTEVPYYFSYEENKELNDYIIINKDIHTCSPEELLDIEVLETYINNKLVYKKYEGGKQ